VDRLVLATSLAALLASGGCADSHVVSSDAGATDARPPARDASRPADDAALVGDAGAMLDAGPDPRVPISMEQADCLGLAAPACASCHFRGDRWYLRPSDVPPPPPGTGGAPPFEACGITPPP
jgi:hypothetical protein